MTEYTKQYYANNKEKILKVNKLYYQNNKEKVLESAKEYRLKNKDKIRVQKHEYRKEIQNVNKHSDIRTAFLTRRISAMKSRHDSVTLTPEELLELIPKDLKCPVFGTKFTFGMQSTSLDKQRAMTVDRIDNSKGYHKDNVVIISFKANAMKSSATLKELYQVADFYYKLEKRSA
jgi:hypothetical protein